MKKGERLGLNVVVFARKMCYFGGETFFSRHHKNSKELDVKFGIESINQVPAENNFTVAYRKSYVKI